MKNRKTFSTVALLVVLFLYAIFFQKQAYVRSVAITACMFATLTQFYNICYGFVGISNFGYAGFMAIGAYASALLATDCGIPVVLSMILSTLFTALCGFLLMIPCLRMHGFTPGIVTLAFAKIVQVLISAAGFTNGEMGYWGIAPLFQAKRTYLVFAMLMVVISVLLIKWLMKSKIGLAFHTINDDSQAAASIGTNVKGYKLLAMTISCAGAGFVGAFYAHYLLTITPQLGSISYTVEILCMTMFGGIGTIAGPVIGAVLLTILTELLRFLEDYRTLIYGVLLIVVILFYPKGIMGMYESVKAKFAARRVENKRRKERVGNAED